MTNDGWGKLPTDSDWTKPSGQKLPDAKPLYDAIWPAPKMTPEQAVAQWPLASPAWDDASKSDISPPAREHTINGGAVAQTDGEWGIIETHKKMISEDFVKSMDEFKAAHNWPAPASNDGWGKSDWSLPDINGDSWSIQAEDPTVPSRAALDAAQEAAATLSRQTDVEQRASVLNSLTGKRDEWVMETDGELNKREEVIPTVTPNVPTGFYIAYHTGKWLHAVLSGPYPDKGAAIVMADAAYARMTKDSVFQLAFENKFERNGIYIAEIPLSARRHGAYGVLA